MAPKTTRVRGERKREKERGGEEREVGEDKERGQKGIDIGIAARETPMTRSLRDMTLFKVATGGFTFALISRDGSFSRGIVLGQVLS